MTVRGKTNAQGRKGHSGAGKATTSNLKAKNSISREPKVGSKGKAKGGLAQATGRGLKKRK